MTSPSPYRRLLILSCSMTKRDGPQYMPARDRYDGPLWRTLRHVDPDEQKARVAFVSAEYGFREARTTIENYDRRMTPEVAAAMKVGGLGRRWPLPKTERRVMPAGEQGGGEPEGLVRVNSSVSFGTAGVEPHLPEFFTRFPKIVLDLSLSDEVVDLYLERTDVAFRIGRLQDSNLVARKIGTTRRRIVASPDYLARHGMPVTPEDLAAHNCLGFNFRRSSAVWPMRESGRIVERMLSGNLLANNAETLRRAALAGIGLVRVADYHLRDYIERGDLVEVMADPALTEEDEIHAVYKGVAHMPVRLRAFLDFFVPRLQRFLAP